MKGKTGDKARIEHIIECIEEIKAAVKNNTFDSFNENHVLRIAVVKWLEIIGEAAKHISDETKAKYTGVEWQKITSLRNIVVHEYFGINYRIIWDAATVFLEELKNNIEAINLE